MLIGSLLFLTACNNKLLSDSDNIDDIYSVENIQEIDLNHPENSYPKYDIEFSYNNEYQLPDGRKIIEEKNLYLEDSSGNRTSLIEVPEEETEMYVKFCDMIDDNRFYYYIIYHESTNGAGVYNVETGEDFRIENCEDHSGYVPTKVAGNYLWFERCRIADFKGFGKMNLNTYEFTEIDCSSLFDNGIIFEWGSAIDISPDGTKVALYKTISNDPGKDNLNAYQVAVYSLTEEKIIQKYRFYSENKYTDNNVLYYSDKQVYLYAYQYENNPKEYLYIINLNDGMN